MNTGDFAFTATAKNSAGKASAKIKIVCGDNLALTPPMGWNSYDAFGDNVVESEVLANARYVAEKMQPVGWDTIVVDYCWSDPGAHDNNRNARANAPLATDQFGRLLPAPNRFPSAVDGAGFKPLADASSRAGLEIWHSHHARHSAQFRPCQSAHRRLEFHRRRRRQHQRQMLLVPRYVWREQQRRRPGVV